MSISALINPEFFPILQSRSGQPLLRMCELEAIYSRHMGSAWGEYEDFGPKSAAALSTTTLSTTTLFYLQPHYVIQIVFSAGPSLIQLNVSLFPAGV